MCVWLSAISTVRLTRDLVADGYTHNELARQTRSGELHHIRRGAYGAPLDAETGQAAAHLQLIEATVQLAATNAVVSHVSAAVLHGLPVLSDQLNRVQLTRPDVPGGKKRGQIHLHAAPLALDDVVRVDGIRTTSLARTVVDLGRSLPFDQAVIAGDVALRNGLTEDDLVRHLLESTGRPGMAQARRVARFLDGRSESPGESLSRVNLHLAGLPAPDLQYDVFDLTGVLVGRTDFCWAEHRTLGEFDGRVKYGRLLKPGETAADAVYREKLREDALRDLGWQVVRWIWADLKDRDALADRLLRAFAHTHASHHTEPRAPAVSPLQRGSGSGQGWGLNTAERQADEAHDSERGSRGPSASTARAHDNERGSRPAPVPAA